MAIHTLVVAAGGGSPWCDHDPGAKLVTTDPHAERMARALHIVERNVHNLSRIEVEANSNTVNCLCQVDHRSIRRSSVASKHDLGQDLVEGAQFIRLELLTATIDLVYQNPTQCCCLHPTSKYRKISRSRGPLRSAPPCIIYIQ